MQLSVQSAYANKALFFFKNKEALAVLCSVAKHSLELLEHSSSWGNVRRGRRTGFRFRLTGKARLVVKKKKGNRQIHSKKWSVIVQIVRWRDTVTLCDPTVL